MKKKEGFTLIELLIVIAIIAIIAAIAIPSLIRARVSANESQAIGDSRTMISGLATFASANCGFFPANLYCTTWEENGDIAACIANYATEAPQFLTGDVAGRGNTYTKGGYVRVFEAGAAPTGTIPPRCDPNGRVGYCYDSYPSAYYLTGVRSFVAVGGGTIYEAYNNGARIGCNNGLAAGGDPIS